MFSAQPVLGFRPIVESVVEDSTQDVRLTGLYEDMHPGGFPAFLRGKMMAIFQIWGDFPVEKLRLKMPSRSCLALGPRAWRNVGWISSGPGAPLARI